MGRSKGGDDRDKKNLQALLARLFQNRKTVSQAREQTLQNARQGLETTSRIRDEQSSLTASKNYLNPSIGQNPPPIWDAKLTREGHIGISQMDKHEIGKVAEARDAFQKYLPQRPEPSKSKEQEHGKERERDRGDER